MRERYDFAALGAFIRKTITHHPIFEGVDLTKSRLTEEWRIERVDPPSRMRSGDWVIWDKKQGDEQFDLYFMFDESDGRSVTIRAQRLARDQFEFVSLSVDEWVELTNREANNPAEPMPLDAARNLSGFIDVASCAAGMAHG